MPSMRVRTHSEKETVEFAKKFARSLKGGETILLIGELGAGKTTFTRALARALGIKSKIKSPTFTLLHIHSLPFTGDRKTKVRAVCLRHFVHCDACRVDNGEALKDIGLMDWVGRPDTLVLIEWGEKVIPLLKGRRVSRITFSHGASKNDRTIVISN